MPADPYVYSGTRCLRSRLGIRDPSELALVEAEQTSILIAQLELTRLPGRHDLAHLRTFHRRIFGDIYVWAGELRTVAIAKDESVFALPLAWQRLERERNIEAARASHRGENSPLLELLGELLEPRI